MEITGKVIDVLPLTRGVSKAGNDWSKQEFVIETPGMFPRKICISMMGETITKYPLSVGQEVTVSVDIESREYNGKWYTSIRAWKMEGPGVAAAPAQMTPATLPPAEPVMLRTRPESGQLFSTAPQTDDLPF